MQRLLFEIRIAKILSNACRIFASVLRDIHTTYWCMVLPYMLYMVMIYDIKV